MKIIFLDIDGVLNCEKAYKEGFCKYLKWGDENKHEYHQQFYPPSKELINRLIVETESKVVISSTWRNSGIERMQKIWQIEGMAGEIIDITPHLYLDGFGHLPRGCEIKQWLNSKGFYHINYSEELQQQYIKESGIENYVIIDDDSDMLYQQMNNFVHVLPSPINKEGFKEENYQQAKKILIKDL